MLEYTAVRKGRGGGRGALILLVVFLVGLLLFSSVKVVPPGYVGVQVFFGTVRERTLDNGLHFVIPMTQVVLMSIRTEAYTMSGTPTEGQVRGDDAITALTKEGLSVKLDVTVWYHLEPSKAAEVYRTIGMNYVSKIVRPAVRTAIRDATVHYLATDIYSGKREELTEEITERVKSLFGDKGVVCEGVLLRNVVLPQKVQEAINEKIAAEQEAQKMEYVLQKEKKEAERRKIEAEGIAQANTIIANSLTQAYLQWYFIQSLSELSKTENTTFVIIPFDEGLVPMLDVASLVKEGSKAKSTKGSKK